MKTLVLANPGACLERTPSLPQVLGYLGSLGVKFDFHAPQDAIEVEQAARQAVSQNYSSVIVAGGDGTAHHALQSLAGSETALGLLPFGNGNDFARNLGLPLDPFLACRVIASGRTRRVDLARVRGPVDAYYAGVGGFGLDAAVNRRANQQRGLFRGPSLYLASVIAVLIRFRPIAVEIASESGSFSGEAMFVVVANGGGYGGGLRIAPQAKMSDGWLDVVVVRSTSKLDLLDTLPQLLRGTHVKKSVIQSWRAQTVELRKPPREEFFCDGDFLAQLPIRIEAAPATLRVLASPE